MRIWGRRTPPEGVSGANDHGRVGDRRARPGCLVLALIFILVFPIGIPAVVLDLLAGAFLWRGMKRIATGGLFIVGFLLLFFVGEWMFFALLGLIIGLFLDFPIYSAVIWGGWLSSLWIGADVVHIVLTHGRRRVEFGIAQDKSRYEITSVCLFADQCVHRIRESRSGKTVTLAVAAESPCTVQVIGGAAGKLYIRTFGMDSVENAGADSHVGAKPSWRTTAVLFRGRKAPELRWVDDGIEAARPVNIWGRNFLVTFDENPIEQA